MELSSKRVRHVTSAVTVALLALGGLVGQGQTRTKRIKIEYKNIWLLAGVVEELRNHDVPIPPKADEIVQEGLLKVNFPKYMRTVFPGRRARLIEILESLDVPATLPNVYRNRLGRLLTKKPRLAPFRTTRFFTDRVLGVGLKSYPYVIDVNADGRKDLLVGDHDGFIYVYLNENTNREPAFGRGERLRAVDTGQPLIVQANPKMSLGDLRRKACLDLVLGNYGGKVAYLPNRARDGTLRFAVADARFLRTESGDVDVGNYAYPELVDWDNDGFLDLVVGNIDGRLMLFRNMGRRGQVVFDQGREIAGIEKLIYPCPVFVDWNSDGKKDVILGHRGGTIIVYLNVGTDREPRFKKHGPARHKDGRAIDIGLLSHPFVADFNHDGRKDLVVGNDPGQVTVFLNIGTDDNPVFDDGTMLKDGGGELIMGVHSIFVTADFNGDGRRDLLAGHEEERLRLFVNKGSVGEPVFDEFSYIPDVIVSKADLAGKDPAAARFWDLEGLQFNTEYLGNLAPCVVDWHNTGRPDLLVGNYTGLIYFFKNVGTRKDPKFARGVPLRRGSRLLRVAGFATPVVCDWNNDAKKDLVVGDLLGRIHVFVNTGSDSRPVFDSEELIKVRGEPVALGPRAIVEVADIDGDHRKDLLVGNRWGRVYALLNTGTDREPRFDAVEQLRDKSALWRKLYAGMQFSVARGFRKLYNRLPTPTEPKPMNVIETSCPRVVDFDNDGKAELLISHRYGRVFVYDEIPHPTIP